MSLIFSPNQIEFIESGLSLNVASRDRRCIPSVGHGLSCKVETDRSSIRLWISKFNNEQLLLDSLDCGSIALVMCDPLSHKTWQVKGDSITRVPLETEDFDLIARHIEAFAKIIAPLGFPPVYTQALYQFEPEDVVALRFVARALYDQTPGPNAGQVIAQKNAETND